jgi:hypothetical protein
MMGRPGIAAALLYYPLFCITSGSIKKNRRNCLVLPIRDIDIYE